MSREDHPSFADAERFGPPPHEPRVIPLPPPPMVFTIPPWVVLSGDRTIAHYVPFGTVSDDLERLQAICGHRGVPYPKSDHVLWRVCRRCSLAAGV